MATMEPVTSSQIAEVGYDEGSQTLSVRFKQKDGTPSPNYYNYSGVDPETANAMETGESVGKFFYANVKGKFDFTKIEPAAEDGE